MNLVQITVLESQIIPLKTPMNQAVKVLGSNVKKTLDNCL